MDSLTQLPARLQHSLQVVPLTVEAQSGFCHRRSKLSGDVFTQAVVFGWLSNPEATLVDLTSAVADLGVTISPQGLDQRLRSDGAAAMLATVLQHMVAEVVPGAPVVLPLLQRFSTVTLIDSSTIVLPSGLASVWQGCGGTSATNTRAAVKLGVGLDLVTGQLDGPYLSAGRAQDKGSVIQQQPVPAGGLRIADRGFWSLKALAVMRDDSAHFLSYLPVQTVLLDPVTGQRIDLLERLSASEQTVVEIPVLLGATHRLPARLLARREPAEVATDRERRLRDHARHKGEPASAVALARAGWTLMVTSLDPDQLTVSEALALLRARWQIELLFKCWKDQLKIDTWRSSIPTRIHCELLAKLIGCLVSHWVLVAESWSRPDRSFTYAANITKAHALALLLAMRDPWLLRVTVTTIAHTIHEVAHIPRRSTRPATYQLLSSDQTNGA